MFAEARKRLPERSISDLLPRDLLARAMAALLPRSIAPDGQLVTIAPGRIARMTRTGTRPEADRIAVARTTRSCR